MLIWIPNIIPYVSLFVSIVSLIISFRSFSMQERINKIELQLKEHDLELVKQEELKKNTTCVEARIISVGNNKHKLKIWNSGYNTVYEVSAALSEEAPIVVADDSLLPYDNLEPNKSFEVPVIAYFSPSRKFEIETIWKDENGLEHKKTQMGYV